MKLVIMSLQDIFQLPSLDYNSSIFCCFPDQGLNRSNIQLVLRMAKVSLVLPSTGHLYVGATSSSTSRSLLILQRLRTFWNGLSGDIKGFLLKRSPFSESSKSPLCLPIHFRCFLALINVNFNHSFVTDAHIYFFKKVNQKKMVNEMRGLFISCISSRIFRAFQIFRRKRERHNEGKQYFSLLFVTWY